MNRNCFKCGEEIPAGRLKALPNAKTCVKCSGTSMKRSVTITGGEKEDTYNDIVFLSQAQYEDYFGKDQGSYMPDPDDEVDYQDEA